MKITTKRRQAISLIVLVITIIIMIILATTVILSLSSSDIVDKANKSVADTTLAQANERATMCIAEWELMTQEERTSTMRNLLRASFEEGDVTVKKYVEEKLKESGILTSELDNEYKVADNGRVTKATYTMVAAADETPEPIQVPVPVGFTASRYEGENTVAGGFVIYETNSLTGVEKETAQTTYNQFVWVPVEGAFEREPWRGEDLQNTYVEPLRQGINYLPNASDIEAHSAEIEQYNKMKESVGIYGGFYIGRYEAGDGDATAARTETTVSHSVVSKKKAWVYNHIAIDSTLSSIEYGDDQQDGCAKLAREAYAGSSSVTSSLIYGVQWDAALKFIEDEQHSMTDSSTWGNYSNNTYRSSISPNNPAKTGACENWKGKNIYDMAGNVWEWTYEAYAGGSYGVRVLRGGSYYYLGTGYPASGRSDYHPVYESGYYGFRVQLFLK